jgi:hypothetical protein
MMNPVDVENEIIRLSQLLEHQTRETSKRAQAEGAAYVAYKKAYASALIQIDGRNKEEREAKATMASIAELDAHRHANALLTAAIEAGRNIRQQLSALQSINGNVRHLLTNATGVGG